MNRGELLRAARTPRMWDLAVVGGGATGLGVALDAAARGWSVVLVERGDFAQGTSSRATKLVHGGVRYLAQGHLGLVREALHERSALVANAPHVAQPLPFVVPAYAWGDALGYGAGLLAYRALAGAHSLGPTEWIGKRALLARVPTLRRKGLRGAVRYWDAQFDDARLAVLLARAAAARGAVVLNHCAAVSLPLVGNRITGVIAEDLETGQRLELRSRCVINAAGVWVDEVQRMDAAERRKRSRVAPSQGVHLVVDHAVLPAHEALLLPRTADGRVLFALPWLGRTILGTTDTPREDAPPEPRPLAAEVDFILRESAALFERPPTRDDVRSAWVGLRPLVAGPANAPTRKLSREHHVWVAPSGMVTVTGGKWTTYRAMADDVLSECVSHGLLPARGAGATRSLLLPGADGAQPLPLTGDPGEHLYGSEVSTLRALPGADHWLTPGLSEAMVRFAARHEMARSVEDVLARRSRLLFLDAREAARQAPAVARILADELGESFDAEKSQRAFEELAALYATLPD